MLGFLLLCTLIQFVFAVLIVRKNERNLFVIVGTDTFSRKISHVVVVLPNEMNNIELRENKEQ